MTVVRLRRQPRPLERAKTLCPVCYSLAGEPCRKVLSVPGAKKLKLGGPIPKIHAQRRARKNPSEATNQRQQPTARQQRAAASTQQTQSARPRGQNQRVPAQNEPAGARRRPEPERVDPASGRRVVSAFDAVAREYGGRRRVRVDNGAGARSRPSGGLPVPTPRQSKQIDARAATVTVDQALAVPCVGCRALAGQPCRTATSKPLTKVHLTRRQRVARMGK